MALEETDMHSFIVKIWKDEEDENSWRGHITHAFSKRRTSLKEIEDILVFIRPYLEEMGIRVRSRTRLLSWIRSIWRKSTS